MRSMLALAVAGLLALAAAPAHAKTCKDVISAKARSAAQLSDASRERRARESAVANWSRRARDTYGLSYQFWRRAEEKQVNCGGGASAKHCTVSAKPCRLL
jgi:Tfp pilus assembly protein PilE